MKGFRPCRYFWLAILATVVATLAAASATGSQALGCLFGIGGGGMLGWLASSADTEVRRG